QRPVVQKRSARKEAKRTNACQIVQTIDSVVLAREPESAAIGIERHGAVVAPTSAGADTAVSQLGAGSLHEHLLLLGKGICRIARQAPGILHCGFTCAV